MPRPKELLMGKTEKIEDISAEARESALMEKMTDDDRDEYIKLRDMLIGQRPKALLIKPELRAANEKIKEIINKYNPDAE